jgi:hypothetical protein
MDTPRRRLHVDVAEKLLDRAEIVTPSGERVAYRWQQRVMSDGRRHAERGSAAEGGADENWWKAGRRSAPIVCQGSGERIFFLDCAPSAVYVHLKFLLGTRVRGVSWVSGIGVDCGKRGREGDWGKMYTFVSGKKQVGSRR